MTDLPTTMRQIHSLVTSDSRLELSIGVVDMPVVGLAPEAYQKRKNESLRRAVYR